MSVYSVNKIMKLTMVFVHQVVKYIKTINVFNVIQDIH